MKAFSLIINLTAVIVIFFSGLHLALANPAQTGFAESGITAAERACDGTKWKDKGYSNYRDCYESSLRTSSGAQDYNREDSSRLRSDCTAATSASNTAQREVQRSCSNSGISGNCMTKARECEGNQTEEDADLSPLFQLNPMVASALGGFSNQGACPTLTGSDYKSRRESLEREIKTTKGDIEDAKKDLVTRKKDVTESFTGINEDISNLDKERKEAETQFSNDQLEQEQQLSSALRKASGELQALQMQTIENQIKARRALAAKNSALLDLTKDLMKLRCNLEANEMKGKKGATRSSTGLKGLTQGSGQTNSDVNVVFLTCMKKELEKRRQIIRDYEDQKTIIEAEAVALESRREEISEAINEMKASSLTMKANATTAKENAFNAYVQSRQNLVQKMLMLSQDWELEQQQIKSKTDRLEADVRQNSNDILQLGPQPQGSTTGTYREVMRDYSNFEAAKANEFAVCCGTPAATGVNGASKCGTLKQYEGKGQINLGEEKDGGTE